MFTPKPAPAHLRLTPKWHITVLSADGQRMLFHAQCEDFKEIQCLATEARSQSLGYRIWIRPPADTPAYSWD
jgi:hypothetical protein